MPASSVKLMPPDRPAVDQISPEAILDNLSCPAPSCDACYASYEVLVLRAAFCHAVEAPLMLLGAGEEGVEQVKAHMVLGIHRKARQLLRHVNVRQLHIRAQPVESLLGYPRRLGRRKPQI